MLTSTNGRKSWSLLWQTGKNQHRHLTESKPGDDVIWDIVDVRILGQMLNFMESNVVDLVTHIETVRELWKYLNVLYYG